MTEKDYSHRSTVQKLGVKPDERVEIAGDVGTGLRGDVKDGHRAAAWCARATSTAPSWPWTRMEDAQEALVRYRARLRDSGYLWIITRKRGHEKLPQPDDPGALRQARRPDRQQDLLDRRRPLGHPLRGAARAAAQRREAA